MQRTILHSDLNCFYASVEAMLQPALRGQPVAVCGSVEDRHGIVLTKSYEAKRTGVKTGMAIWQAKQCCPQLIVVPPHYDQYLKYSALAHEIYHRYTDQIEPYGLDECWLDVTGSTDLHGSGREIADALRETFKSELGLTISVGVSYNKLFAKLGSDMKKPDGTTVITPEDFREKVWPLPAADLFGVGRATEKRLRDHGISTIGGIAKANPEDLRCWLGVHGVKLWQYANGQDESRVSPFGYEPVAQSVGHGITFKADLTDNIEIRRALLSLAQGVGKRLRAAELAATGVAIYVRDSRLNWQQYQTQIEHPTQNWRDLAACAYTLFVERYRWLNPIRALTITAIRLLPENAPLQLHMLNDLAAQEREDRLERTVLDLRRRFGEKSITLAGLMDTRKLPGGRLDEHFVLPGAMHQ